MWYRYLNKKDSSESLLNNYIHKENNIIISDVKEYHKFALFDNIYELYTYIGQTEKNNRNYYEIIMGDMLQKPHFDIDVKVVNNTINYKIIAETVVSKVISSCVDIIYECFNINIDIQKDILVYSSHGKDKYSYHIIINNYCHSNNIEAHKLYEAVILYFENKNLKNICNYVDHAVYSTTQQFRLFGCEKYNSNRPKMLNEYFNVEGTIYKHHIHENIFTIFKDSLITDVGSCKILPCFNIIIPNIIKSKVYSYILNDNNINNAYDMLGDNKKYFNIRDVYNNFIYLTRIGSSICPTCKRYHDNEHPFLLFIGKKVYFDCRRSSKGTRTLLGCVESLNITVSDKIGGGIFHVGYYKITEEDDSYAHMLNSLIITKKRAITFKDILKRGLNLQTIKNK